jgi:glycosyltransferase involved in cell wall biosynthesis
MVRRLPVAERPLRIALLSYRSKPHVGGQGIYIRNLSRALVELGHHVEVFSGQPYPELDEGVILTRVPGQDLYREPDPFRRPGLREFRDLTDVLEFSIMCTAGFPEPRTFSRRVVPLLAERAEDFDVVHDNQSFGAALLQIPKLGLPLVGTMHHPVTVDRRMDLAAAPLRRKVSVRRWYGFLRMQAKVIRQVPLSIAPSQNSVDDAIHEFGLSPQQLVVVPVGVDFERFRPRGARVPGRLVAMCSADVPLKGLPVLLRALATLPPEVTLTCVTKPAPGGPTEKLVADLGLADRVSFVNGLTDAEVAELMSSAEVFCVPSLYEGFSLPALEAMACGAPVVASAAGAIPEVVGTDGRCGVLVPPGDATALANTIHELLEDPDRRDRMGAAARARAVERFSWQATARGTVEVYRRAMEEFTSAHR